MEKDAETFLKPMLKAGLVSMNEKLELTSKGEEVLAKLWFIVENAETKILAGFTAEESTNLKAQLHRIQEECSHLTKGNEYPR
ncbi:MAG TPA: hypothetical protein VMT91_06030 [Anaerolineales bacterium]|nr:hypothetical protein [Anaerolineales bacterium]